MGKKFETHLLAKIAQKAATKRASDVDGGSTKEAYQEAKTNLDQANMIEQKAWEEFLEDPNG